MARPPTLRAWPTETASVNDNRATDIAPMDIAPVDVDWNALCEPGAPPDAVAVASPQRRFLWRDAACGLAGALAIAVAILCFIAR